MPASLQAQLHTCHQRTETSQVWAAAHPAAALLAKEASKLQQRTSMPSSVQASARSRTCRPLQAVTALVPSKSRPAWARTCLGPYAPRHAATAAAAASNSDAKEVLEEVRPYRQAVLSRYLPKALCHVHACYDTYLYTATAPSSLALAQPSELREV